MRCMIEMESAVRGLLWVNGQFCGPVDREGQTFPASENAEIFIQFFPLDIKTKPAALEMVLQNGSIARLEPETVGYALLWADGVIQLEIHPETDEQPDEQAQEQAAQTVLLRYLSMRLAGDADAAALLMEPHAADRLPQYDAVVPLRFAPLKAPERFDQCAGIVTRLAPNIARVDTVLAMTAPAGQGRRLIERMELLRTNA